MSGGVTTNYGLAKPNFNTRPWDTQINGNFDLIDTLIYTLTQIPNIGGMWKNSTQYTAGQNVLDGQSLTFYQCVVSNVSAAAGTFAADRAANPGNWTVTSAGAGTLRYDQGQALSAGQILQALNNLNAFSYFLRYDAAQTLTTPQLNQVLANLQLGGALKYDGAQTLTYNQILQVLNNLLIDGTESILVAAATTDIGNAGSQNVRIDGTTTIVSFGARPNKYKILRFTGSLTLTNSASLVLPGGKNIQTQAGDTCFVTSDAGNNWYIRAYQRANGLAVTAQLPPINSTTAATAAFEPDTIVRLSSLSAFTRTLPQISAVFVGYRTGIYENNGLAIITIAANGTDQLDGVAGGTALLFPKQRAYFYLDVDGWHIGWVERQPLVASALLTAAQAVSGIDLAVPVGYPRFALEFSGVCVTGVGGILTWRTSDNGAGAVKAGASDYTSQLSLAYNATINPSLSVASYGVLAGQSNASASSLTTGAFVFYPGETGNTASHRMIGNSYYLDPAPNNVLASIGSQFSGTTSGVIGRSNLLRISPTAGNVYGSFSLRGLV